MKVHTFIDHVNLQNFNNQTKASVFVYEFAHIFSQYLTMILLERNITLIADIRFLVAILQLLHTNKCYLSTGILDSFWLTMSLGGNGVI